MLSNANRGAQSRGLIKPGLGYCYFTIFWGLSLVSSGLKHLCPEMRVMAKNRHKAGDSNWMPKVAPWRVAILAIMANLDAKIGGKSQISAHDDHDAHHSYNQDGSSDAQDDRNTQCDHGATTITTPRVPAITMVPLVPMISKMPRWPKSPQWKWSHGARENHDSNSAHDGHSGKDDHGVHECITVRLLQPGHLEEDCLIPTISENITFSSFLANGPTATTTSLFSITIFVHVLPTNTVQGLTR